jgi:5-oxoprolinase (ATP-hydrolysing)
MFRFAIDRGGTFTDVHCILPDKQELVLKLLSVDPSNYYDAPTEGIRRILAEHDSASSIDYSRGRPVNAKNIASIRMGTTVATNALLERKGARTVLLITQGFGSLLEIGNQSRPDIFDLSIFKLGGLYEEVVEVDERVMMANEGLAAASAVDQLPTSSSIYPLVENETSTTPPPPPDGYSFHEAFKGTSIKTLTGEKIIVLQAPNLSALKPKLQAILDKGITSLAVAFLHSYIYPEHEILVGDLATEMGFTQVSLSAQLTPTIKLVPRGQTACASAYLTPSIKEYLSGFLQGFEDNIHDGKTTEERNDHY